MSSKGLEESIHFQQLEQKIIGALGVEPTMIADIKKVLSPNMFSVRKNQVIYKAILDVYSEGLSVDEVSVVEQLRKAENNQVTPHDVMQAFKYASPMDAMNYSQVVAERWIKQQIREVSEKAASSAEREVDAFDLLHDTIKSLENISNDGVVDKSYVGFSDLIEEALIRVNEEGTTSGVMTGLSGLDDLTNGFQKGDLTIIAGRPAMGKSAFVTTIQKNAAKMGYKSLLFSLEMSKYQVACRLVSRDVDLPVRDLVQRRLSTHQKQQFNSEVRGLSSLPILVDDTARISIDQLRIKAREAKRKEGIDLLIVDYLQLMNGDGRSQSREQEISTISRGLKVIAKELDIPVVALSQLSRAVEQRENKRPLMSDLRESGSIEQDADAIFFLYRPEYYYKNDGVECPPDLRGKAKVITGKFRNGESNDIILNFLGTYSSFEDEALDLSR